VIIVLAFILGSVYIVFIGADRTTNPRAATN